MMIRCMLTAAALAACGMAAAKIPAPVLDEAAKAKAAEAAAKTAWQAKVDAWQLCKAQDRVAAYVRAHPVAKPAAAAPAAPVAAAAPSAAPAAAAAAKPPAATPTTASQGGSTPNPAVASNPPTGAGCADPGAFAYTPPEQKPLETSGAHSPAGTATSPPSVRAESGSMTSGKTGEKK